ncbi:MAG: cytochrome-c oxidase, cbb3-type subunit II, partial [Kiloniellaceae bacterium]
STIEKVQGMRPYSPLELAGRKIYIREGCYNCHSQMIRPLRDEVERYGRYSLAAESMYDHPFQWGSKRTGPDLARVGGRYSDDWHVAHMADPRSVVPESIMPGYPFLARTPLRFERIADDLKANRTVGVPYSDEMIAAAAEDMRSQVDPDSDGAEALLERYPKAQVRDFDGDPAVISELDALVAYLQMLGTLVDFDVYKAEENFR